MTLAEDLHIVLKKRLNIDNTSTSQSHRTLNFNLLKLDREVCRIGSVHKLYTVILEVS